MTGRLESANVARASFARSSATSAGTTRCGASITSATFFGPTAAVVTGRRWSIRETRGYGAALANVQPASTSVVTARPRTIRRASRRRRKTGGPFRGRAPTISGPAGRWALSRRIATEFWETARRSASVSWRGRPAVVAHPERGDRLGVPACMSRGRAEGDDRLAADERLQAGDAGGRVDDRVGRRHQLVHVVGEAEDARARLAGEVLFQAHADLLVEAADADDIRALELERRAHGAFELADAPAASGDDDQRAFLGQAQRAASVGLRHRLEELLLDEGAHDACASRSRNALDRTHAGLVHDQVEIHPRVRPQRVHAEVADRCHGRDLQDPAAAQVADDARRGGMGRDDHVGVHAADEAEERLRAEQGQARSRDRASGREAGEEEALEPVRPGQAAELDAVDVPAHERDDASDVLERVVDDDLGRFSPQLGLQRAGDGAVALALLGREDEHAAPRLRRRVRCRSEIDGLAHGSIFPQKPDGGNLWKFAPPPRRRIYMKRLLPVPVAAAALVLASPVFGGLGLRNVG